MNVQKWWRPAASLFAGIALACAFPPIGWGFLAPLGIAALTCVIVTSRLRGAAGWSLVSGLLFFVVLLHWLTTLGPDAWLLLALYCSLWVMVAGIASWCVARLPGWPLWIALIWVAQEAFRDRVPLGGFPWGRLAFSQSTSPDLGYASVGGAPLITFVTALAGTLIAAAVIWLVTPAAHRLEPPINKQPRWVPAVAVVGAALIWYGGLLIPRPTEGQTAGAASGPARAVAAVVQGSVPRTGLNAMAQRRAVLDNHVNATIALAGRVKSGAVQQPEFVVWPENSSDLDPFAVLEASELIDKAADAIGVPILVGGVTRNRSNGNELWNVGIVWSPKTGAGDFYVKRHPVPFGEFLPARSLLAKVITRFDRVPYDFAPGSNPGVLQLGPARIGDVICFEIADDKIVREAVMAGGRAITVQTNNATFTESGWGGSAQPDQQAAMATLRAVEHGRSVIIAATSGVSSIIAPDGTTVARAPLFAQTELVSSINLRDSITVSDRLGEGPEWIATAAALMAIAWGFIARVQRRGGPGASDVDGELGSSPNLS